MSDYEFVEDAARLSDLVEEASREPLYALDTEFHREQTYYPRLGLVQLAWPGQILLLDPLATSPEPLLGLLESPATAVMHAPDQDLEILQQIFGRVPSRIFDTQKAAGFCGMRSPSLHDLLDRFLNVRLQKGDRLTDWLRRPLQPEQLDYAAGDVRHLLELHDRLRASLAGSGRLAWCEEECEKLRLREWGSRPPEEAWQRVRDLRRLPKRSLPLAVAVAAWRERRAALLDIPPRYVLGDLAMAALAQSPPRTRAALEAVRGVDRRALAGAPGDELLAVVADARRNPPAVLPAPAPGSGRSRLGPVVALVSSWLSQAAGDDDLDPALVATRADIESFLQGNTGTRLAHGWRYEQFGTRIEQLAAGRAAVALEPSGALRLEERSGRPL